MNTIVINRWGKSLGLRIPEELAKKMHIEAGKKVQIELKNGELVIKPTMTIEDLMEGITPENNHELLFDDEPIGLEQW